MCWALGFLVILIIFLVKIDDIKSNLKQTNFFERLFHKTPTFIQNYEEKKPAQNLALEAEEFSVAEPIEPIAAAADTPVTPLPPAADALADTLLDQQSGIAVEQTLPIPAYPEASQAEQAIAESESSGAVSTAVEPPTVQEQQPAVATSPAATQATAASQPTPMETATTTAKLCFVTIDGDGSVSRKEIARTVVKSNSPLTGNIRLLLTGPSQLERSKGCQTLIPDGTRLLSATVTNGTAFLSFSEEFEYNRFGVEGYLGQLMQIVYTATEFSTVNSVQVLIDGQKKEYLGSEGVWIGSPLSRASFK